MSNITKNFNDAFAALNNKDLKRAEELFKRVIEIDKSNVPALNLLVVVLMSMERFAEAEPFIAMATSLNQKSDVSFYNYGLISKRLNKPQQALSNFSKALSLNSNVAETWNNRGTVFSDLEKYDLAIADFDKAISLNGAYGEAYANKGKSLARLKRYDEAFAAYDKALSFKPDLAEAWFGRGNVFYGIKRYDEAFAAYDKALSFKPHLAEAWLGRGNVFYDLKRHDEAFAAFDKALSITPDLAEAWLGRGNVFRSLKRFDEAFAAYDRALSFKPHLAEAWRGRGNVFSDLKRYDESFGAYDKALSIEPDLKYAEGARLHAKMHLCDWTKIDAEILHLLSAARDQKPVGVPFLSLSIPATRADQLRFAKTFVSDQGSFSALWRDEIYSHDRIRISYLSADFRHHPLAQLAVGLFEHHDKSRFEIMAISSGPDDGSDLRNRIRSAADNFIDVRGMPDSEVAEFIRRAEIDILVDLSGFTEANRFGVFARRASPLQVNFLCYTGTMGADCMDYIIADPTVIPKDQFEFYSEKVVWLPDTYQANDRSRSISGRRPTRSECNLPDATFVFSCFNATYKITSEVFAVWMRLLAKTQGSVLWLLETNPTATQNLRREAEAHGITPRRLIFAPPMTLADHMARIGLADLFVDTLPYNAHTTASDALWAGLPVLTCLGDTFAGRVAASLIRAIGLPELVTTSLENYETLALKIAGDPSLLRAIRGRLVRNRDTYPLFDTARYTRHIEAAYVTMWERYQRREMPDSFAVSPK
jgi:protein O-GlcNAc transferase